MAKPGLDAIRRRCEAATPGPWEAVHKIPYWVDEDDEDSKIFYDGDDKDYETPDGYVTQVISIPLDTDCRAESDELGSSNIIPEICEMESDFTKKADYEFIAHARQDIPALLDYIKDLHQQIHTLEKSLDSNFKGELVAKARLQAVNFSIDNNGCGGELTNDDWCKFCFMRPYCEERKS